MLLVPASSTSPPFPQPLQMYGTLKGLEQSMNPQLMKYACETDVSIALARRENRHRLFSMYPHMPVSFCLAAQPFLGWELVGGYLNLEQTVHAYCVQSLGVVTNYTTNQCSPCCSNIKGARGSALWFDSHSVSYFATLSILVLILGSSFSYFVVL